MGMGLDHHEITPDQTRPYGIVAAGVDNGIDKSPPTVPDPDAYLLIHFTTGTTAREGKGVAPNNPVLKDEVCRSRPLPFIDPDIPIRTFIEKGQLSNLVRTGDAPRGSRVAHGTLFGILLVSNADLFTVTIYPIVTVSILITATPSRCKAIRDQSKKKDRRTY